MTVAEVDAAARAYGLERETLLPERAPLRVNFTERTIGVGEVEMALRGDTPDEVMADYLRVIRTVRGLRAGTFMTLRDEDLAILSDVLSHEPETVEARLVDLMGLSQAEAAELRRMLLKKRVLAPAAGLVLGVSVFTSAAAPQPPASDGSGGEAVDHGTAAMHVSAVEEAPQSIGDDPVTMAVHSTVTTPAPAPSGQSSPQVPTGPSEVLSSDASPDVADVSAPEVPADELSAPEALSDVEMPQESQEGWTPPPVVTLPDSWEEPEHVEDKLPSALTPDMSEESGRSGSDGATGTPGGPDLDPVDDDPVDDDPVDDDPVEDDPVEDDPVEDDPVEDDPVEDDPVEDDPVEDDPVDDDPVDDDPVEDDPVEDDPVEDDPVEDDPVDGDPVDGDPVDGDPVDDDPVDDDPIDDGTVGQGPGQSGGSGNSGGKGGGASPGQGGGKK